jgi:hypothetical protein
MVGSNPAADARSRANDTTCSTRSGARTAFSSALHSAARELRHVVVADQPSRADIEQPPATVLGHHQIVRNMLAAATCRGLERQPKWLRQNLNHLAGEIQCEQ